MFAEWYLVFDFDDDKEIAVDDEDTLLISLVNLLDVVNDNFDDDSHNNVIENDNTDKKENNHNIDSVNNTSNKNIVKNDVNNDNNINQIKTNPFRKSGFFHVEKRFISLSKS